MDRGLRRADASQRAWRPAALPLTALEHDRVLEARAVLDQGDVAADDAAVDAVRAVQPRGDHPEVKLQFVFVPAEIPVQPADVGGEQILPDPCVGGHYTVPPHNLYLPW